MYAAAGTVIRGKGAKCERGGKSSVQTPASGQGADPNLTNSGGQQTFTQQTPSPNPGPAAAQAPKVASTSTASSNIPQASSGGVATPGGSPSFDCKRSGASAGRSSETP